MLSQITTWLDPETVKLILDRVAIGAAHHAKTDDLAMVEGDLWSEQEVWIAAAHPMVEMHMTDWAKAQKEVPPTKNSARMAKLAEAAKFNSSSDRTNF